MYHSLILAKMEMILQFFQQLGMKGMFRSSYPEVFLRKGVLKICSKLTGEHPCQSNFIEITLRHGYCPSNLLHIFRTPSLRNASGRLLLSLVLVYSFHYFYVFYSTASEDIKKNCAGWWSKKPNFYLYAQQRKVNSNLLVT